MPTWRIQEAGGGERVKSALRALEADHDLAQPPGEFPGFLIAHVTEPTGSAAGGTVTGSTRLAAEGVIAGAVLQAARRTAALTQEDLAEASGVAVDTVKRWENGQRPLGRVKSADLARLQRQLRQLGARPALLASMLAAVDADEFTARAVAGDCSLLATEVTTRQWSALVAWAVTGRRQLRRGTWRPAGRCSAPPSGTLS